MRGPGLGLRRWPPALLVDLALWIQAVCTMGTFELQIHQVLNPLGLLQSGECCDGRLSLAPRCPPADPCDTFFRACLKEYQARVAPSGPCTFGTGSTGMLGGNSFTLHLHGNGRGEEDGPEGRIEIPFKYAWPKSFSIVLDALDYDNQTSESAQEELIERVMISSMLNPGEQWQTFRHHGRHMSLEYRLRFRCDPNYYGPLCNKFCRARHDFFGHFACDSTGTKVCMEGWTGPECLKAICRQGCHLDHGSCSLPGECKCHYGWQGLLCDQCVTFPGCVHGSCSGPWQCVCDTNWGGLLCDKDLNYCGTHQPCRNGGTCANTEPDEYQCVCKEGFRGRNCDIVEHACLSNPCVNGGTCLEDPSGFICVCAHGWTGHICAAALQPCVSSPCGHGSTCRDMPHGFECVCSPGWIGRTCQIDTNECEAGVCVHARSCRNLIGGYLCDCLPGWTGPRCDTMNSSCQGRCLNGGHCEASTSRCLCLPGYSGTFCQSACPGGPCLHGGQCVEQEQGVSTCLCPLGYTGASCEVELPDACNPNPCPQGAPCHSTDGGYLCGCPEGFHGNRCTGHKEACQGQRCSSDAGGGSAYQPGVGGIRGVSVHTVLLGSLVLLVTGVCVCCLLLFLSRLRRRKRKEKLERATPTQATNNQREPTSVIRNLVAQPATEEIELTLKANPAAKVDICNREREKLNRFHSPENQELEV